MLRVTEIPPRYKPDGEVKSGGFGDVVFCDDQNLSRRVAIKFIQDKSDNKRLLDEISALQILRSKHVVQIYDIVTDKPDEIGIVEEFIEGDDLWKHPYPRASIKNYLKTIWQIVCGLADIHEAGIIHRDIKPNNMKLDHEGIVKIYDFGLARPEGPEAKTKGFLGTEGFAAPELYKVGTVEFSRAIDVYAFGATAYFLAGDKLATELKSMPPAPLPAGAFSKLPLPIPDSVSVLLERCLDHDPANRPSIADVRDEIARNLLKDKHQALAVLNGKPSYLNKDSKGVSLELAGVGIIEIFYDGLHFKVKTVSGEVDINNRSVKRGDEIPGSCVVALGGAHRKRFERAFITFDVSNPEVVL